MILSILSALSLLLVSVTMFARAHDMIFNGKRDWYSHLRSVGLVMVGSAPIGIVASFLREPPTLYHAIFYIGLSFVFFTTPHQIPWWQFISRGCPNGHH